MPEHMIDDPRTDVTSAPRSEGRGPDPVFNEPTQKRGGWVWALLLIALVVGGLLYYQHRSTTDPSKAKAAPPPRAVPITTAPAKKGDIGIYVEALGTVTPVYTVTVTSRVQGEIMKVYYTEGQMVHKGDPLLDIDSRPYEAALTQTEGQLAHDQALLNEAGIDLDRYKSAFSRNAIAQQQVYDQEQAVQQYQGTVKNDEGMVANAKVNLVYTHITSPIDGRVGLRLVDPGNIVQANSATPLVVVTQLQPITVIFSVAEDYLPQIQQQLRQGHTMAVDALDRTQETKIATGSLLTLDNQIDTSTGTVKLKAIFPNKDSSLFPNQFVNTRLLVETQHDATLVPAAAIQRNAQGSFVYVVKPDATAQLRNVKPGVADGNTQAVQGVKPTEVVAISGFDRLQDGAKVAVRTGRRGGGGGGNGNGGNASGDDAP
ncbi:MAG: efflux RND transporter periplasmic adaptor subunit [Candidatus Acidiferrales bacterium]|jgi:multidrug efflux system membrane fusion protein